MQTRPTSNSARLSRAQLVEFQDVAALDHHHLADRTVHGARQLGVQLQLPVFAVDGDEILRFNQVDDQLQLFLAGVPADVYRRLRTVVVNDMRVAAEEVVHHAIDGFLIAGNNARREHNGIARLNARVLMVVHGSARER